jgi:hypothetical protein
MVTRYTDQAYRIEENERNAASMVTSCTDPSYRISEQNTDTNQRRLTRQTPSYRISEQNKHVFLYWVEVITHPFLDF